MNPSTPWFRILSLGLFIGLFGSLVPAPVLAQKPAQLTRLQNERVAMLQELTDQLQRRFKEGLASQQELIASKHALHLARLELATGPAARVVILKELVADCQVLEDLVATQAKQELVGKHEVLQARLARLDAQIRLAKERSP